MSLPIKQPQPWYKKATLDKEVRPFVFTVKHLARLDEVWNKVVGKKSKFWVLTAVQHGTLYVQVKAAVARNELIASKENLIKKLNSHFEESWITGIEIK